MAVSNTSGTRLYIGPIVDVDEIAAMNDGDAVTYFEGLSGWVEVEETESLGEMGDASQEGTFTSLNRQRVRKLKGARDAGSMSVVVGRDPGDAGQAAMIAAEKTPYNYAFKLEYDDARDDTYTDSVEYFGGLVSSRRTGLGGSNDTTRRTLVVGINTSIYEVLSEAEVAPVNVLKPAIMGAAIQVGVTLTAYEGTWLNNPTSYAYQWQHDASGNLSFTNVSVGGTSRTYVPVVGDVGDSLRCVVTASNGAGASSGANSAATTVIIAA